MSNVANPRAPRATLRNTISLAALIAAAALAGCNKPAPQALANAAPPDGALPPIAATATLVDAPAAQALPAAPPPPVARVATRSQGYAFADRAYAMSNAFSAAPPDYTYDYDGVRPWVWRSRDDAERVVEPVPGGQRVYYYEAGSATPFFIQDPSYGYGFANGALVTVYDHSGRQLPYDEVAARRDWAGRYLARSHALYDASRQQQRQAIAEPNWRARRGAMDAQRAAWQAQQQQDPDWRAYHDQYGQAEEAHWQAEREQRLAWAARVDQMNNDQARAQREWAEAQQAGRPGQLPGGPPMGPPPGGPRYAQQPGPQGFAPQGPAPQQPAFGRPPGAPPPVAAAPGASPAEQAAAARAAQEHAALLATQQKQQAEAQAAAAAQQRQVALAQQ